MRTYIRTRLKGGFYFFTVNLSKRHRNRLLIQRNNNLREAFKHTQQRHPFVLDAIAALPEHLLSCGDYRRKAMIFQPVGN